MKARKILAAASAIDLGFRYGCTPAWWQLWKGMYEAGVDLVVTPYRGRPVESPWWRTAPNPTYREGESYQAVRDVLARMKGDRYLRRVESDPDESALDKLARETISCVMTPGCHCSICAHNFCTNGGRRHCCERIHRGHRLEHHAGLDGRRIDRQA